MAKIISFIFFILVLFDFSVGKESLTFAVLSYGNPVEEYSRYKNLSIYLSQHLKKDIEVVIVDDIDRLFQMFKERKADMAVGCSVLYFELKQKYNVEAVAIMKINGKAVETGVIITKKDSPIQTIKDLKNKKITLGSPICMSNCVMPLYMLSQAGITQEDVINIWSSGTDKGAILSVLAGIADAAGVKKESIKPYEDKIKIISESPSFPRHIIMVSKNIDNQTKEKITELLLNLNDKKILSQIGIDGFVKPDNNMFNVIKNYRKILDLFPTLK